MIMKVDIIIIMKFAGYSEMQLAPIRQSGGQVASSGLELLQRGGTHVGEQRALAAVLAREFVRAKAASFPLCTEMFDQEVATFLLLHPRGTVVQVGGALNGRFERLDNGQAHWVDLDCASSLELQAHLAETSERRRGVRGDVHDVDWHQVIRDLPGPYCFVSESHMTTLGRPQVSQMLVSLANSFPGSWLIVDTASEHLARAQNEKYLIELMSNHSCLGDSLDSTNPVLQGNSILDRSRSLLDVASRFTGGLPLWKRIQTLLFPKKMRQRFQGYLVHRLILQA